MEVIKKELKEKFFRIDFKHNILNSIIINTIGLLLFCGAIYFLFYRFYSNFINDYYNTLTLNFSREITEINATYTNNYLKKNSMNKVLKQYVKNRHIISIWVSDQEGFTVFHSSENIKLDKPNMLSDEFGNIFYHNWTFTPDGSPVPLKKDDIVNDFLEIFSPVYNIKTKRIDYIVSLKFHKYLSRFVYIPKLNIYVNIFYVIIISLSILFISLIIVLVTIFSLMKYNDNIKKGHELISKLYDVDLNQLPMQFDFNIKKLKNSFLTDFIKYINHLLDQFHMILQNQKARHDKIKEVIPPVIFKDTIAEEKPKVIVKTDSLDYKHFLWNRYFKNQGIKEIPHFSTGLYHYYKEKDSDLIFKYFDIGNGKKGFFVAKLLDIDINSKLLLFTLMDFLLNHNKENIDSADGYLSNLNSLILKISRGELKLDVSYIVLNTETGYIEIASSNFSPLIHYKAETEETTFYEFKSVPMGNKLNDEFMKHLNKESFQLSNGDIILVPSNNIEKMVNFSKEKLEIYRITDVIRKNGSASAEVLIDKVKKEFNKFSVDFSKLSDLFMLIIKRDDG